MNLNTNNITRTTIQFLQKLLKFHYIISISLVVAGVAFTLYYINAILNRPDIPEKDQATSFSDKFDTETIKKINTLKYSSEGSTLPQPSGRTNPFTE